MWSTRGLLPGVFVRAAPEVVVLLFAVSQLSAIVDMSAVRQGIAAAPWWQGCLLAAALTLGFGLPAARNVRRALLVGLPWLRTLPIDERSLALHLLPLGLVATTALLVIAPVLGLWHTVGVWVGASTLSLALGARAWHLLPVGVGAAMTGPFALLGFLLSRRSLGVELRAVRGQGEARGKTWSFGTGAQAILRRDLLGLWRHTRWGTIAGLLATGAITGLVQYALRTSWTPEAQTLGSLAMVGALGWLPWWMLGRAAQVFGVQLLDRTLPLRNTQRVLGLWLLAALSLAPPTVGVLLVGTGTGWLGALRVLVTVSLFAALATRTLVVSAPSERPSVEGSGILWALVLSLCGHAFGPWWMLPQLLMTALALLHTTRRIR